MARHEARCSPFDEPTEDEGAKREIYALMEELAESGVAILFVSSEMEEVLGMADRALVMHEGRITGELSGGPFEEAVMQLATATLPTKFKPPEFPSGHILK